MICFQKSISLQVSAHRLRVYETESSESVYLREKRTSHNNRICHKAAVIPSWSWALQDQVGRKMPNSTCYQLQLLAPSFRGRAWADWSSMSCGQELEPTLCTVSSLSEWCLTSKWQASKPLASKHVFWALTAPLAFLWLRPPSLPAAPSAATDHLSHLPHRSSLSILSCSGLCVYCSVCHSHKLISLQPWYTNVTTKHTQQSVISMSTAQCLRWIPLAHVGHSSVSGGIHMQHLLLTRGHLQVFSHAPQLTGSSSRCYQRKMETLKWVVQRQMCTTSVKRSQVYL